MHQSSFANMRSFRERFLDNLKDRPLSIIDIGSCDVNGSYRQLFDEPLWTYCGVDLGPGKNVDVVVKNPYYWREIKSNSADVIISGQAFEHIEYIWLTMLEVYRVLKRGGICCIIAPSAGPEHRWPVDCWRIYHDGFMALSRFASIEPVEVYTQSDFSPFTDGSKNWKDCVYIGRKPRHPAYATFPIRLKHLIIRRLWSS